MRDTQRYLPYTSEKGGDREAVPGDSLCGWLEVEHAGHTALQEDSHLGGESHADATQTPGGRETGGRGGVDKHGYYRLYDT